MGTGALTAAKNTYSQANLILDTVANGVTGINENLTLVSVPKAHDFGDVLAVYLHNSSNDSYSPWAIRAASFVDTPTIIDGCVSTSPASKKNV